MSTESTLTSKGQTTVPKAVRERLRLKPGDRITTSGGIRGIILSIKDDVVIIKIAPDGIKMEVAKNAIASVTTQDSPAS